MRATLDGEVIAEAADDRLIRIEGNWYFPPDSLTPGALSDSPTPYTCPWKGECQYHDIRVAGGVRHDHAWSYPLPMPSAIERVGADFSGYVAFDPRVQVG